MKVDKKTIIGSIGAVLVAGGIATAAVMPKSTTPTTPVKTEATDTTNTQTGSNTTTSTTPDTTTNTPAKTATQTTATTNETAPAEPTPDPVTVDHQSVRWAVDTSKPQSFLWYCDRYMSDGTMTTLNIGSATEYGNSSGVPKIKYNCPKL